MRCRERDPSTTASVPFRVLEGFIEAVSQADGIGLIEVDAFTTLVVRTDNSVYRITILRPHLARSWSRVASSSQSAPAPV